jgi:hypothetical protein
VCYIIGAHPTLSREARDRSLHDYVAFKTLARTATWTVQWYVLQEGPEIVLELKPGRQLIKPLSDDITEFWTSARPQGRGAGAPPGPGPDDDDADPDADEEDQDEGHASDDAENYFDLDEECLCIAQHSATPHGAARPHVHST